MRILIVTVTLLYVFLFVGIYVVGIPAKTQAAFEGSCTAVTNCSYFKTSSDCNLTPTELNCYWDNSECKKRGSVSGPFGGLHNICRKYNNFKLGCSYKSMCKWTPKLDNQKSPVEYVFTNTLTRGNKICEKYIKQFSVGESEKLTINGVLFDLTYLGEKRLVVGSGDTRSEAPGERWLVNGNEEHVYYFANILQNHVVEEIRDVKVNIMGKQGGGHLYPSGFIQIDEENYYPSECGEGQLAQFIEEIRSEYMLWKLEMGIYRKEWILLILFLIPIVLGVIYYFKKRKRRE